VLFHLDQQLVKCFDCLRIAVVRRGENGVALAIMVFLKTILLDFVTPDDVGKIIQLEELRRDIRAKLIADSSLRWRYSLHIHRVAPEQIAPINQQASKAM